ncbi:MAG TPA: alkaline phosphatase family protein [Solirubrobacteraceae bacterium]|nr:alkaline phosphatase family protein [Solirubrobacteraceae bacterium]
MARKRVFSLLVAALVIAGVTAVAVAQAESSGHSHKSARLKASTASQATFTYYNTDPRTTTPIKHLVVIFDENISFDHYFGTYPHATNPPGEPPFHAAPNTPRVNGLNDALLYHNPNSANPQRLDRSQAVTCDQNHGYTAEQSAYDHGLMDQFVQDTAGSGCTDKSIVMDYYDGNTVTAEWNYAQNYAMSDNNWDTTFGPSTEGAISVSSGLSSGGYAVTPSGTKTSDPNAVTSDGTIYGDLDPYYDQCSDSDHTSTNPEGVLTGQNIGDLLNTKHITWGWFQSGFDPTSHNSGGAVCGAESENIAGTELTEYTPHWNPFNFTASTANPAHLAPTSEAAIGRTDQANHQYDLADFYETLKDGNMPSVSYLKPSTAQSGHPGESDPLDEQKFIVNTVNQIEKSKYWASTAIVITYDDSDGWYDHVAPKLINGSHNSTIDEAACAATPIKIGTANGRCGYSQRLPMIVISPYTRDNYVSSNLTDTTSVVKFIEDNWLGGARIKGSFDATSGSLYAPGGLLDFNVRPHLTPVILNPTTGAVESGGGWG